MYNSTQGTINLHPNSNEQGKFENTSLPIVSPLSHSCLSAYKPFSLLPLYTNELWLCYISRNIWWLSVSLNMITLINWIILFSSPSFCACNDFWYIMQAPKGFFQIMRIMLIVRPLFESWQLVWKPPWPRGEHSKLIPKTSSSKVGLHGQVKHEMSQGQQATVTNHKVSESRPKPKGQELESLQLGPLTQKVQALLN